MKRASNHQTNNLSTSGCFLFLCLIIRLTVNGLLLWGRPVFQGILSHFRLFRCIIASLEEVVAVGQFACKSITRRFLNMILRVFSQFFLLSSFTLFFRWTFLVSFLLYLLFLIMYSSFLGMLYHRNSDLVIKISLDLVNCLCFMDLQRCYEMVEAMGVHSSIQI